MEHFVLERLRGEVKTKTNQFGGIPGLGTNHDLIKAWDEVLESLDEEKAVCALISIDFAKAFNTMGHQACLHQLKQHGASTTSHNLVRAFLTGRQMEFRVNNEKSTKRPLRGGSPQGTLLGNFLFILATDHLENGISEPLMNDCITWTDHVLPTTPIRRRPSAVFLEDRAGQSQPVTRGPSSVFMDFSTAVTSSPLPPIMPDDWSDDGDSFRYFQPLRAPYNRISDTCITRSIYTLSASQMEKETPLPVAWDYRPFKTLKYVDDFLGAEKLSTECSYSVFSTNRTEKFVPAAGCQRFFEDVSKNAADIGMTVNPAKTQLLCVTPRQQANISCFIYGDQTNSVKISSQKTMKILGFTFGSSPTAAAHIDALMDKFRRRVWLLRHLGRAGLPQQDITRLYQVFLVPVLDYSSICYHSMLTKGQSKTLEDLQAYALRIIYGQKLSYRELLELSGVERLDERRLRLLDAFLNKTMKNEELASRWFPRKTFTHHNLRKELIFVEKFAKNERLFNSPLYFMRRRLNEIYLTTLNSIQEGAPTPGS